MSRPSDRSGLFAAPAVLIGLLLGVVLIVVTNPQPLPVLRAFFVGPFSNRFFLGNMVSTAGYLLVAALGVIVAFRAGLFNLGGDGQLYAGATVGTMIVLHFPALSGVVGAGVLLLSAALFGGALAALAGFLKKLVGAPELITSYLLSSALVPAATWYISGPGRDPQGSMLATPEIGESLRLARLLPPSALNTSLLWALALAVAVHFFLFRTLSGYELRMYGGNPQFASYAGIKTGRVTVCAMAASGAFHGLAGGLMILGTYHAAISEFSLGLGWNAIAVALVARRHPLAAIASALVFSFLQTGSQTAMLSASIPFELSTIVQAVVLLVVTVPFALPRLRSRQAERASATPTV